MNLSSRGAGGCSGRTNLSFKVVIVGDQSVGKTHILHQYVNGYLPKEENPTLGVEYHSKTMRLLIGDQQAIFNVKLCFYDTAGEERYHSVTALTYRNAKGTIIVYDVTCRQSFENVERWLKDTCQLASQDCQIMILGNKTDVDRFSANSRRNMSRQVSLEEGLALAERNKVIFYEVSAVENTNITEAMNVLANQIVDAHLAEKLRRSMQSSRDNSENQQEGADDTKAKLHPRSRFECCLQSSRHDDLGGGTRRCC